MVANLRNRFGAAGLVIAVVALVAALAGGAYAASGALTGKQKKEVTNIAKKYAGAKGDAGAQGPAGANGKDGSNGSNGSNGAPGKSLVAAEFTGAHAGCAESRGGSEFEVEGSSAKVYACNGKAGKEGSPWTAGGTLPGGATETGTWGGSAASGGVALLPIALAIPLTEDPEAILVKPSETKAGCPGLDSEGTPSAEPGKLCVYASTYLGTTEEAAFLDPSAQFAPGAAPSGAIFSYGCATAQCLTYGTWAVTAEE
jgi:hypothetical protein